MNFKNTISILIFSILFNTNAQEISKKPKLVVGVVVDQMRYDYLTRFKNRFSNKGFKRLINDGFLLENAHYSYIPTYTAVGHATIYTGTNPINHGIIGNNWYDKYAKETIYCVDDFTTKGIGLDDKIGQKSPKRLMTTTLGDELHLAQNMKGKAIGISIKDRSSVLPAGHTANAAYWFDEGKKGWFVTSSFYMDELPIWLQTFNEKELAKSYASKTWNTYYDIKTYTQSLADDNTYEKNFKGKSKPTFPYNLQELQIQNGLGVIKETPFGNTLILDFAKATIVGENLGKSEFTDFLSISFSSTDYVGHKFGPNAIEVEDTYIRLDMDIANLLAFLDAQVGKNNYTLFLTADHGAVNNPAYLQSLQIPAHYFDQKAFENFVKEQAKKYFASESIIENISNYQIFLNHQKIEELGFELDVVTNKLVEKIINFDGVYKVFSSKFLQETSVKQPIIQALQNGYNQKFSGDIVFVQNPATLNLGEGKKGTSHGSGYFYDTHVPIIFYGKGIKKGASNAKYDVTDIAPTIANLLQIEAPNASTGKVINEVLKK